jgi:hypothetical protein
VVGGPLVGPAPGDSGDWDFCCCPSANFDCSNAGDQSMCDGCGEDSYPNLEPLVTEVCVLNCPPRRTGRPCFLDCVSAPR